ncbi:MAG: galactose-1-phosphate uridylyltransferase [Dehalococcoidia bacterium]|nr:galactose-1-phosphate uridylyltransferase [Dehalococcoidia bacterium]MDZ4246577.1 galactose-1-phosphate uridylyltransferase [Dehalococcoidia bacterium]
MSEIRQDKATRDWVIIARERGKRPTDFVYSGQRPLPPAAYVETCPFCPGHEAKTPGEVLVSMNKDSSTGNNWQVRVFPNKFPALSPGGTTERTYEGSFFMKMHGVGIHEVIVETPVHNRVMGLMETVEVEEVWRAYWERYNSLRKLKEIKLIIIFKNQGISAGTSLEHPHSQLVAAPIWPSQVRRQLEVAMDYYNDTGRCLYFDVLDFEVKDGQRIVMQTEKFVVFHPFASRVPFETWIMPTTHNASFGDISSSDLSDLACVVRANLVKLYRALNNPDYNYVIHTAPLDDENKDYFQWHIRITPRMSQMAGFELGSGIFINPAIPEETAVFMRDFSTD